MKRIQAIWKWFLMKPVRTGILVFIFLLIGGAYLSYLRYRVLKNDEYQAAVYVVESVRSRLQQSLQYSLSPSP